MNASMNIRRFVAANSRTALRQVRETLGGDAVILSNRSVDEGVEILAAPAGAVEALTRPVRHEPEPVATDAGTPSSENADAQAANRSRFSALFARRTAAARAGEAKTPAVPPASPRVASPVAAPIASVPVVTVPSVAADAYAETFADRLAAAANEADDFVARIAPEAVALSRPQPVEAPVARAVEARPAPVVVEAPVETPAPLAIVAQSRAEANVPAPVPPLSLDAITEVVRREVADEVGRGIARELGRDVVNDMTRDVTRDVAREVTREVTTSVTTSVTADVARRFEALHAEINTRLETVGWTESMRRQPGRTKLMQELILAGFSPSLARHVQERLPDDFGHDEAHRWARGVLGRNLPVAGDADDVVDAGGVFALVGPTGVGKTTTVAKLAARFALKHGVDQLALITTDGFRIGAQDQLRIYGKILGIPVHSIHDQASLTSAIETLANKKLVLIDTAGLGPRDERVAEQIAMLRGAKARRLVALNATVDAQTIDHVIATFADRDFAGCVITKTDEAMRLGPVLDAVIRHRLKIHHVSTGQRVPEDLERPDVDALIGAALRKPDAVRKAFVPAEEDEPVWMSAMAERAQAIDADVLTIGELPDASRRGVAHA